MEKSDKLDGSKGFEILYLCHPQTGQASKEAQPEEGGKNKSRTLWGTTTTTRGSCWELHTAHVLSAHSQGKTLLHPSTAALSSAVRLLSVLSVNYMALATETRSYPPPIFILFFTDSRLREGENSGRRKGCHCTQSGTFNVDKKATKIYSLTSHDDYSNAFFFSSLLFLVPIIRARAIVAVA